MRRVIYRTEYFEQGGKFLREEEYDAYFHTIPQKGIVDAEQKSLNGCKLLHPKHVPSRLTKEQWDVLLSKKPDCQLLYASLFDVSDSQYAVFSMYEQKWRDLGSFYTQNANFICIYHRFFVPLHAETDGSLDWSQGNS